jgi:hypothetical protein
MSKKFVVALDGNPHFRDPITKLFMSRGWRVWHWYADIWLLAEMDDWFTPRTVYACLEGAIPSIETTSLMVMEMGHDLQYYGRAPSEEAWAWMSEHWGTPDFYRGPPGRAIGIITAD